MAIVDPKDDPSTESSDYRAMKDAWEMIDDILLGAVKVRERGTKYLPKFPKETVAAYDSRKTAAPWRPEFEDALRSLASKPFTKQVTLNPDAPDVFLGKVVNEQTKERRGGLVDDIDGQGNSLHVFARETFLNGLARGLEAIYVTFPRTEAARTLAEEQARKVRPYWVHVRATEIIDVRWQVINGVAKLQHIRIKECTTEPNGYAEVTTDRIRVVELVLTEDVNTGVITTQPIWRVYVRDNTNKRIRKATYVLEDEGVFVGLTEIPVVLFFTGQRAYNYRVKPPLIDLADMQMELYRAHSNKEQVFTFASSPMLVGRGFAPPSPTKVETEPGVWIEQEVIPQVEVGPGVVLFAYAAQDGVQPDWDYIQPASSNLEQIRENVSDLTEDIQRLAMQPTTPRSGTLTATGKAIDAAKSHSAVEAWALALKDVLDQALAFTCQWLKITDSVTACVHTDFGVNLGSDNELTALLDAVKAGALSKQTFREEASRRGALSPQFDEDKEEQRIAEEEQGLEPAPTGQEPPIDPTTGKPIPPLSPAEMVKQRRLSRMSWQEGDINLVN